MTSPARKHAQTRLAPGSPWSPLMGRVCLLLLLSATVLAQGDEAIAKARAGRLARGEAKFKAKDYEAAIEEYTAAIKLDPTKADAYVWRAAAKTQLQRWDEAAEDTSAPVGEGEDPAAGASLAH